MQITKQPPAPTAATYHVEMQRKDGSWFIPHRQPAYPSRAVAAATLEPDGRDAIGDRGRVVCTSGVEIVRTRGAAGRITQIVAYRGRIVGVSGDGERIGTAEYAPSDHCGIWHINCCGANTRYRHDRSKTAEENLSAVELLIALQISAADASAAALAAKLIRPEYA